MKHRIWINHFIGAAFAFALSVSAVGNLTTGFDLEVESLPVIFLWCACFSFGSALLFRFKFGGIVLSCLTVLAAPIIWKDGRFWEQLQSLSYIISSHYHDIYNWPILGETISDEVSLPLIVLSAWSAFSVSWSFCRRKRIYIIIPPVIFSLVLCVITTDTVPDAFYLYLTMLVIALLLLTDWTRRNDPAQGIKLTLRLAIPIAAALAVLFVTNPQEEYVNHVGKYQKEAVSWFEKLQDAAQSVSSGVSFESATSQKLNLRFVGPKSDLHHSVMRVNSPIDGTIYLRGRDYDVYSGTGWEASMGRDETFTSGSASSGKLTIETYGVQDVLYVPYYAAEEIRLVEGKLDNDENLRTYSYDLSRSASGDTDAPDSGYTQLPPDTAQWAAGLAVIIDTKDAPASEKIQRIERYVESSATYDLSTSRMSSEYEDFAQWFLEDSDTGYCVHFATAATVLLRAAGIPARYVEGYMVTCKAGEDIVVSSKAAHAWAEYYDSASGTWCVLEATPADFQDDDVTETTMGTSPSETQSNHSDAATIPNANLETQPIIPDNMSENTAKETFMLPDWMKTVLWIMLAMACIPLQSHIRIVWKRKQWNRGKSNEKTIVRWKQTRKFASLVHSPFPEELDLLAQKASFSQHRIQPDELQQFEDYRKTLRQAVHSKPWYQRILLRWIFAIGS